MRKQTINSQLLAWGLSAREAIQDIRWENCILIARSIKAIYIDQSDLFF